MSARTVLLLVAAAFGGFGCTDVPMRHVDPPQMRLSSDIPRLITIAAAENLPHSGKIPDKRLWRYIGSVPEGAVYRPVNTTFMVEAKHAHEAYLVLKDTQLVAYYLPAEGTISVLEAPAQLNVTSLKGEQ